jgi:hypothetical protein
MARLAEKVCMETVAGKTCWVASTWKTKKEMRG